MMLNSLSQAKPITLSPGPYLCQWSSRSLQRRISNSYLVLMTDHKVVEVDPHPTKPMHPHHTDPRTRSPKSYRQMSIAPSMPMCKSTVRKSPKSLRRSNSMRPIKEWNKKSTNISSRNTFSNSSSNKCTWDRSSIPFIRSRRMLLRLIPVNCLCRLQEIPLLKICQLLMTLKCSMKLSKGNLMAVVDLLTNLHLMIVSNNSNTRCNSNTTSSNSSSYTINNQCSINSSSSRIS